MKNMRQMFGDLRIPLSPSKNIGHTHCLEYLGTILDAEAMEARLPQEKLDRILEQLASVQAR